MARRNTPKWQQRGGRTGYQAQDGSREYNDRLRQQGVMDNNPPGTAYLLGSNNLGYGVVAAYDANNNFIGFVRGNLGDGVRVNYSPEGQPTGISTPSNPAPPPPPATPPPKFDGYTPDSFYNDALSTIAANRRRALDAATEGEKSLASDFGLGITQDDTGAKFTGQWAASDASRGGIDPSNPFSRASLLNKSYFVAGRMGEGSYANRGLLTSGAYQRSQQRDAFRFESGRDQLLKQFASGLQSYRDRRSQAEIDAENQRRQAGTDLFGRNRDNYDRTNPS